MALVEGVAAAARLPRGAAMPCVPVLREARRGVDCESASSYSRLPARRMLLVSEGCLLLGAKDESPAH